MTSEDVKQAYGVETEGAERGDEGADGSATSRCVFPTDTGQIRLLVQRMPDEPEAKAQFEDFLRQFESYEQVEDLGDEAIWIPLTGQLVVRSGDTYFVVTNGAGTEEQAIILAQRVIERLRGQA